KKLYYSIGDVSEITSVEPHVLRYWETIFSELSPKKNSGGNRVYKEKDIEVVLKLKTLIKEKKYSTKGAQQALEREKLNEDGQADIPISLKRDLQEIRLFLNKLLVKL
ncbi:MAG TPA: MerR family transcriptional regulator, partial [Balneolaceae bacterium]|nr:MerR family transcriptional regulator [Balneolaceae bacterium]